MKNLKKLTRKGLDELSNEMPQVNEIQQRECVGGYVYYHTGTPTNPTNVNYSQGYTAGPGTDIRFVNMTDAYDNPALSSDAGMGVGLFETTESFRFSFLHEKVLSFVPKCSGLVVNYMDNPAYCYDMIPNANGIIVVNIPNAGSIGDGDCAYRVTALNNYFNSGSL